MNKHMQPCFITYKYLFMLTTKRDWVNDRPFEIVSLTIGTDIHVTGVKHE